MFLNMCYVQGVGIWTSVLKVEKTVERTQIASTLMAAITVSAKLDLKETHVRFFDLKSAIVQRWLGNMMIRHLFKDEQFCICSDPANVN